MRISPRSPFRRCTREAGHAGKHRWVLVTAARQPVRDPHLTPSVPPCIQSLIDRREAELCAGLLRQGRLPKGTR